MRSSEALEHRLHRFLTLYRALDHRYKPKKRIFVVFRDHFPISAMQAITKTIPARSCVPGVLRLATAEHAVTCGGIAPSSGFLVTFWLA